jgi:hypothetical protein
VLVPDQLALALHELYLVVVQLSDDLRSPEVVESTETVFDVHLAHAFLPHIRATRAETRHDGSQGSPAIDRVSGGGRRG